MKNVEFVDIKKESEELESRSVKDSIYNSLQIIIQHIGLIIWLTFLGIVYIGNSYHAEKVARRINFLQREVKDLRAESITTAAQLMYVSRQSVVQKMVKNSKLDLKESVEPPYKIRN